jgi:hypothetical protein
VAYLDPKLAPSIFSAAWCAYPLRERPGEPGPWVRPVLILDSRLMVDANGIEWAATVAAYGTDAEKVPVADRINNLLIGEAEYRALGLHKPTVFKLDLRNRKRVPWNDEYYMPQPYVQNRTIIAGVLTTAQQQTVIRGITARGLTFPLPL